MRSSEVPTSDVLGQAYPLTPSQKLIWSGQVLSPGVPLYSMVWRFDLEQGIDVPRFSKAFDKLEAACDALRIVIDGPTTEPTQRVVKPAKGRLEFHDFSQNPNPGSAVDAWISESLRRPFDLSVCSSVSALLRLGEKNYVWFLNQHHIVTDATSGRILADALAQFYTQMGKPSDPSSKPTPRFLDFVEYVADLGHRSGSTPSSGSPNTISTFPLSRLYSRSPVTTSSAAKRIVLDLDGRNFHTRLQDLINQEGFRALTPDLARYNFFASLLVAFVARISSNETIALGTTASVRTQPRFRETAGLFIEMLPFHVPIDAQDTFRTLHNKVVVETKKMLSSARPGASQSNTQRTFNSVLNYVNLQFPDFDGKPLTASWVHSGHNDPGHHLRLNVLARADAHISEVSLDFNQDIFDGDLRHRAVNHLEALFDAFLQNPDQRIAVVPLTTSVERASLLGQGSKKESLSKSTVILDRILNTADKFPDAVALREGERQLSYRELVERSEKLALALIEHGAGPGSCIGIYMHRSIDLIVTMLGILRSGAAYVPFEPGQPMTREEDIIADASVSIVVTRNNPCPNLTSFGVSVLSIDDLLAQKGQAHHRDLPEVSPNDDAYVIFTSGSTGRPKGVIVTHEGLADYVSWARATFAPNRPVSMPFFSRFSVDLTVTSLFLPLITGGEVLIHSSSQHGSDLSILDVFEQDLVDTVKLTPAHLAMAIEAGFIPKKIETLIVGGEDFAKDLAKRALEMFNRDVRIFNEYGPTEAVVGCMSHLFDPDLDNGISVPIGEPADGNRIYLLDDGLNPVPIGVIGEIFIGGHLARGYANSPIETAQRFVDDPFEPGSQMYRTGDLAHRLPSGKLVYRGRSDRQVKIRGVRVEPGDVESALMRHPGVVGCVVDIQRSVSPTEKSLEHHCIRCGLGQSFPNITMDADGVCSICKDYERVSDRARPYWKSLSDLSAKLDEAKSRAKRSFDCAMLLSGGKDSVYALYRLAELGPRVLALTLDNGFISDGAKANIRRVTENLGVEHRFMSTPFMNKIFVDSLKRHADVCPGCFKTIYSLAFQIALDEEIPIIVTGLSRGQLFDTRLAPELFTDQNASVSDIDERVNVARMQYHKVDDAVRRNINVDALQTVEAFEKVEIIDFYRYCDSGLDEILGFLSNQTPWMRPEDTGRSTNCLINDVGIYVHRRQRGYHNYAQPYCWDVRLGHKERDAALQELEDDIDTANVRSIIEKIGYEEPPLKDQNEQRLVAYVTGPHDLDMNELHALAAQHLPPAMQPRQIIQINEIPVTSTGKIDRARLPAPMADVRPEETAYRAPKTDLERKLAQFWNRALRLSEIGVDDNYYRLGGDSISAIRIEAWARAAGIPLSAPMLFQHPTIAELAAALEQSEEIPELKKNPSKIKMDSDLLKDINHLLSEKQAKV